MTTKGPLLIVGASGRAAATVMIRRGYTPHVIDLFADADTQRLAPTLKCEIRDYPHGFIRLSETLPPMNWIYTGGLENYPDVIAAVSARHTLLGNPTEVLAKVRDPFLLADVIRKHGGQSPTSYRVNPGGSGKYLRKPYRSAGGLGISFSTDNSIDHYFQEFIEGTPVSAVFHNCQLIGITQQLNGEAWCHAPPFHYCGNLCTPRFIQPALKVIQQIGQASQKTFNLRGHWGLDAIWNVHGLWFLELNPRYCASEELLFRESEQCFTGKAIYYASRQIEIGDDEPWRESLGLLSELATRGRAPITRSRPHFADIPSIGSVIEAGHPIVTMFADADIESDCLIMLKSQAAQLDRFFGVT